MEKASEMSYEGELVAIIVLDVDQKLSVRSAQPLKNLRAKHIEMRFDSAGKGS